MISRTSGWRPRVARPLFSITVGRLALMYGREHPYNLSVTHVVTAHPRRYAARLRQAHGK